MEAFKVERQFSRIRLLKRDGEQIFETPGQEKEEEEEEESPCMPTLISILL